MPPKKKVPARRASGKRVRIGDSTIIPSLSVSAPVSPSGRRIRQPAVGINYKLTRDRVTKTEAKNSKGTQDVTTPASPKRRGRPPASASTAKSPKSPKTSAAEAVKAGRGRPKRSSIAEAPPVASPKSTKRKREVDEEPTNEPPKKRGRPPKAAVVGKPSLRRSLPKKVEQTAKPVVTKQTARVKPTPASAAKRGRPAGSKNKEQKTIAGKPTKAAKPTTPKKGTKAGKAKIAAVADFVEGLTQPDDAGAADYQYWLMKAEPDSRIEKGIDVAYPIDKLATATEPEPWDGVRNAVARNNMRAMRKGDLAFFYHSNCSVPGIVGVMRIAEEHSIDESAFDPTHPYYDEKSSREKPKWDCVKVEFVKKFSDIIPLKTLKSTPQLENMQIAQKAYGRLSVQSVSPDQWKFVLNMAGEAEDLGVTSTVSGYEADTNGETDKELVEDSIGADDDEDKEEEDDMEVDENIKAAYGDPEDDTEGEQDADKQLNGNVTEHAYDEEVQAEKDRVEAIDAFAKEITSGADI